MIRLLALLFFTTSAYGSYNPVTIKGESDATSTQLGNLVTSGKITKTATSTYRLEKDGNRLTNPSFEHSTFSTGWTCSVTGGALCTLTRETTYKIDGAASIKVECETSTGGTLGTCTLKPTTQPVSTVPEKGLQGVVRINALTQGTVDASVKLYPVIDGVRVSTGLPINYVNDVTTSGFQKYQMPWTFGSSSYGLEVVLDMVANRGVTLYLDDAFAGRQEVVHTGDASYLVGSLVYSGATNCIWSQTMSTSTWQGFVADADCLNPTTSGTVTAPATKIPGFVLPSGTPSGKYLITVRPAILYTTAANIVMHTRLSDGTSSSSPAIAYGGTGAGSNTPSLSFTYTKTDSGEKTIQIQLFSNSASTANLDASSLNRDLSFDVYRLSSSSTVTAQNLDTDWASCTLAATQGFTFSSQAFQCRRVGGDLLIKGTAVSASASASEMRMGLPVWNGAQLISKGTSVIPSLQHAGTWAFSSVSALTGYTLIEPSVAYFTFGYANSGIAGLTKRNGNDFFAATVILSINARIPIAGWEQSNIMQAELSGLQKCEDSFVCTNEYSAKVSVSGVITDPNITGWITSCTSSAPYTCTFKTGLFSVAPNCQATANWNGGDSDKIAPIFSVSPSSIVIRTEDFNSAGVGNSAFNLSCQKQGADFNAGSVKAFASDANTRVPGVTNSIKFGASISSTGVLTNNEGGVITSASCSTGAFTVNLTGLSAAPSRCFIQNTANTADVFAAYNIVKSASTITFITRSNGSGTNCMSVDLECSAVKQP